MRTTIYCVLACLFVLGLTAPAVAQLTGQVIVVGVPDRFITGNGGESTSGLTNVGVGARVVLTPFVHSGTGVLYNDTSITVTSATWTVTGPKGAVTVTDTTAAGNSGKVVYFKPDTAGVFTVNMSATTARGVILGTLAIHAANFSGVGIYNPSTKVYDNFNCSPCHEQTSGVFADFLKTNHATVFPRRVDEVAGHFAASCLKCHTVGYNTNAVNNGADETKGAFSVPTNHPGLYDSLKTASGSNAQLASFLAQTGIQCENCHGPAGEHMQSGDPDVMAASLSTEVCAPCHYSSDRHGIGYAFANTAHNVSNRTSAARPEGLDRPVCAHCHTAQGYINETIKGLPQPTPATNAKAYPNSMPIGCTTCHDPHNNTNPMQLRASSVGDACMGCHTMRMTSSMHSAHQGMMVAGVDNSVSTPYTMTQFDAYRLAPANSAAQNNAAFGNWRGWEFPGYVYENSSHSKITERCAACHMAPSPSFLAAQAANFATPDTMLNKLGGHTFNVSYTTIAAGDTTVTLNTTGCQECHGTVGVEFIDFTQAKTKAMLATLKTLLPKRDSAGTTISNWTDTLILQGWAAGVKRLLTPVERGALYNYSFVNNDNSFGVHNFMYAKGLLESSIEQLQLGAGAASISSIKDIPGDQGHRVQVVWNKFPAEDFSYNAASKYYVLREDVNYAGKTLPVKNYSELISTLVLGGRYSVMGTVWQAVGEQPALKQSTYATDVETRADSTNGAPATTNFMVVAVSLGSNGAVTARYSSSAVSGYSVDNIAPFRVATFNVDYPGTGAVLTWKPVDQDDIVKFYVYRGTAPDFTPGAPQAEVTVTTYTDAGITVGQHYYYAVRGVDAAGNLGVLSPTVTVGVERTEEGIPTEFALGQNFPNPFNPTTNLKVAVPMTSHVVVTVYSITGEEIATLVNREMAAGTYNITWNGRSNANVPVASGMYLYRMQADKFTSVRKMVLLK